MPLPVTNQSEFNLPVPKSPSALRTWLFDAETADEDDSNISFPNRLLTTSTTSTKPGTEFEYLIDTDSEPGMECRSPSPCAICNSTSQREVQGANGEAASGLEFDPPNSLRFATPVSDLGPEPRLATSEWLIPALCTEVDIALRHKIRSLKHYVH